MRNFVMFYTFIALFYIETNCNKNKEDEDFIATHEWKVIKKGQKVPSGLHYRMNLATGSNEAKLLDKTDNKNNRKDLLHVPTKEESEITVEEIKELLKNIKDDGKSSKEVKSQFRTYEELKKDMGALNITSKVDAEIIKDLIQEHKDVSNKDPIEVDTIINILEDFDYLVHQFDNGLEFVNQNGFRDIIYKNLNCSFDKIKENTLRLFGSLVQNNARVQIHALETGSIPTLLRFLSLDKSSEQLKSNAVFALGCLLRRFPLAQQRFVENGGVYVILQLFEKSSIKIKLKVLIMLSDLILEKNQAKQISNRLLLSQYKLVNLEKQFLELNLCTHIDKLLIDIFKTDPDDHDSIEKILVVMQVVSDKCRYFNTEVIYKLKDKYEKLANIDATDDNFYRDIVNICLNILNKIEKTEL